MDTPIGAHQRVLQEQRALAAHMYEMSRRYRVEPHRAPLFGSFNRVISRPERRRTHYGNNGPFVPAEQVRELLRPEIERVGAVVVSELLEISERILYRLMNESRLVSFNLVDAIVCKLHGDPGLWDRLTLVRSNGVPL